MMIEFGHETVRTCEGISRRAFLQIGAAGFLGKVKEFLGRSGAV